MTAGKTRTRALCRSLWRGSERRKILTRVRHGLTNVRVAGPAGEPLGFCIVKGDELNQLYVHAAARGTGVAQALIADAERRIAESGYKTAWLA